MVCSFVKINPTQNMTLLVTSPVQRSEQPAVAAKLMAYESVCAEQVGFVEPATLPGAGARLQMMGGEFCGNASMSLAVQIARQDALADGQSVEIPLEVSGADGIVVCRVTQLGSAYQGEVVMPLPRAIRTIEFAQDMCFPVVVFDGIAHAVVPESRLSAEDAERVFCEWSARVNSDAFGILLVDEKLRRMRPLVGVRATGTRVWERGCASGTSAIGAFAAMRSAESVRFGVAQPGGVINVSAEVNDGALTRLTISGEVRIAAVGEAYL